VTVLQAREATSDLADNMEALKRSFFFRGFFNDRGYFDLDAISPADYRSGVLENGKRKAMRIWLNREVLFEPGPEGGELLSGPPRFGHVDLYRVRAVQSNRGRGVCHRRDRG
jgi:hypothetical protein